MHKGGRRDVAGPVALLQAEEAIRVWEKAAAVSDRSPAIIGTLVWAYARTGRRADALRLLGELKERDRTGYVPPAAYCACLFGTRRQR